MLLVSIRVGVYFIAMIAMAGYGIWPASADSFRAEIRRTGMGVPHIKAADWGSLGFGYGYAQTQDVLCTMSEAFVTYRGERSKYFGGDALATADSMIGRPKNIDSDFYFRQIITEASLEEMANDQPSELKDLVIGFASGYNYYIRKLMSDPRGAHAACRDQPWVSEITVQDIYRRLIAATLGAGYAKFVSEIATAQPPRSGRVPGSDVETESGDRRASDVRIDGTIGLGSNAIGFGRRATDAESPLLVGNPHWFWRGPDRFYQAHLTIPGEIDVSGASLLGVPIILIGYNRDVAWTHTVSTARRFGVWQLALDDGNPTKYVRDGRAVEMEAVSMTVETRQADGSLSQMSRTMYRSVYGPLVDLSLLNPALAWSKNVAFAIRDANATNNRSFRTWLRWARAKSLEEFMAIQREEAAMPWVNTIAIGRGDARAWYADIGVVPNVSEDRTEACATDLGRRVVRALPRVPVLDGSRAACDWQTDSDSRQEGALGVSQMPSLLRDDYVANMNDSYWLANPSAPLTGFREIIGTAGRHSASMRTRLGLDLIRKRLAGTDGYAGDRASAAAVRAMVLNSRNLTSELFRAAALGMLCPTSAIVVSADPLTKETYNPAKLVGTVEACRVLRDWDGTGESDARGAALWDEFWARASLIPDDELYVVPFDPVEPLDTPRGLKSNASATLQQAFGAAILKMSQSGYALDAPRESYLFLTRGDRKVPMFGGCGDAGYFTIACPGRYFEQNGHSMDGDSHGNSYLQILQFIPGSVEAYTLLAHSLSDDPVSPHYGDYSRRYSVKEWVRMPFTEEEIAADPDLVVTIVSGG